LNRLQYFDHKDDTLIRGWHDIHVTESEMPYMDKWWIPVCGIGYEHSFLHQVADFLKSLEDGTPCGPTFRDALDTQKVVEAVLDSAAERSWKNVS
jgi:predicted dehydrogenase